MKLLLGAMVMTAAGSVAVWGLTGADPQERGRVAEVTETNEASARAEEEAVRRSSRYIETYDVFASKDPFEPLIAPTGTTTGGIPTTPAGGVTATFEGASEDSGLHHEIKVVDVGSKVATIRIDGTDLVVHEGETFAKRFQLLAVADNCATMLYGDDQFTLCEGESILK